jgi:putative transposase
MARDCPKIAGGTYFFTLRLAVAGSDLLVDRIDALRATFRDVLAEAPVQQDAVVILPDHLHTVWTLPRGDAGFAMRLRAIKADFEARVRDEGLRQEGALWQPRYGGHPIWTQAARQNHVAHCWIDPVRHALVHRVADWPHSSFHRDVADGLVPEDWSGEFVRPAMDLALAAE